MARGLDGREIVQQADGKWVEASDGSPYPASLVPANLGGSPAAPSGIQPGAYGHFDQANDENGSLANLVSQYGPTPFGTAGMPLITEEYGNHGEGGRFKQAFDPASAIVNLPDGKYARVGTANVTDIIAGVPGTRYDPTYGYIAPYEAFEKWALENRGKEDFLDKFGPLLAMAGLGGILAFGGAGAAGAGAAEAGAASAFELPSVATGLGDWTASGLGGLTGAESAAISGAFPLTSGAAGAALPAVGSTLGLSDLLNVPTGGGGLPDTSGGSLGDWSLDPTGGDPGALPGGMQTVTPPAAPGVPGSPVQSGFNLLDPSTYGGTGAASVLAGATGATKTALEKILANDGSATSTDWLSVLGGLGQTALGIGAGLQQSGASEDVANRVLDMGQPSLARYEASFQPGFDLWSQPAYKGALDASTDSIMRSLSASSGSNPWGNPGAMSAGQEKLMGSLGLPALQNYRETNRAAGFGNVPQYASLMNNSIGQQGGAWEAAGSGLQSLLNPPKKYGLDSGGNIVLIA